MEKEKGKKVGGQIILNGGAIIQVYNQNYSQMVSKITLILIFLIANVVLMQNLRVDTTSGVFQPSSFLSAQTLSQMTNVVSPTAPTSQSAPVSQPEAIGDVKLSHSIPSTFLVDQVFQFEGEVNATKLNTYLLSQPAGTRLYELNMALTNKDTGQKTICTKKLFTTQRNFTQQCLFTTPGEYYLGIYIGNRETNTPKVYKIVNAEEAPQKPVTSSIKPTKPQNLSLSVEANDLYIKWTPSSKLTKVVFLQKYPYNNRKEFIASNNKGFFKVPYAEFRNFSQVPTTIQISHAETSDLSASERTTEFSDSASTEINVTEHLFQEIRYPKVQLDSEIKSMVGVNQELQIDGTSIEEIDEKALVVSPKNRIEENKLQVSKSSNSRRFRFRQRVQDEGVYIVEINHAEGYALVNTPVYAGSSYPLLPDFMDLSPLHEKNKQKQKPMTMDEMRKLVLKLINDKRRQSGVGEVILDNELNELAQLHATDMAVRGYISHTNLYGEDAGTRAKKQGIYSPVGENIAVNDDLEYGRYRLDRSPNHLKNTINGFWTRVGVGIYQKYNGMYYFTEEYSCEDISKKPITPAVISQLKSQIVKGLNSKAPVLITQNTTFSSDFQSYVDKAPNIASVDVGSFAAQKRLSSAKSVTFSVPYMPDFLSLVQKEGYLNYLGFRSVAIALRISNGILNALLILH